jgi:hypothetical protein
MKNAVFWNVSTCGSLRTELAVTVNVVSGSLILFNLMMMIMMMMMQYVAPKRRFLQEPHGVTFQNTAFFKEIYVH